MTEFFAKKYGKYLFEQNRASTMKEKDDISATLIYKEKEVDNKSPENEIIYSTIQKIKEDFDKRKESEENVIFYRSLFES